MHNEVVDFVRSVVDGEAMLIQHGPVFEIGGRNINGTVRPLFNGRPYASIDLYNGRGVDLIGDVCRLNPERTAQYFFKRPTVTCVVCCEVLEHTPHGKRICRWAYRALAPHGIFIVTAASPKRQPHSGIDGGAVHDGEHYRGISADKLRSWLRDFSMTHILMCRNGLDIYAVARK
jgi:hypothetical protein